MQYFFRSGFNFHFLNERMGDNQSTDHTEQNEVSKVHGNHQTIDFRNTLESKATNELCGCQC